jgi:hypothetical protein
MLDSIVFYYRSMENSREFYEGGGTTNENWGLCLFKWFGGEARQAILQV